MADVFISYRRIDRTDRAQLLRDRLQKKGYSVFLDTSMGAGNFQDILRDEIEKCTYFLLLTSDTAFDRCWEKEDVFRMEIECAKENGKIIIPVMDLKYSFPDRLPDTIDFVKHMSGTDFNPQHLDYSVDDLVNRMMRQSSHPAKTVAEAVDEVSPFLPVTIFSKKTLAEMGDIANRDVKADLNFFRKIISDAVSGEQEAQAKLGEKYYRGNGIRIDRRKALFWLREAAKSGNPQAMFLIGKCYKYGLRVRKDPMKAAYWFEKSASHPQAAKEAVLAIAECYLENKGVTHDLLKTSFWLQKAASYECVEQASTYEEIEGTSKYLQFLGNLSYEHKKTLHDAEHPTQYPNPNSVYIAHINGLVNDYVKEDMKKSEKGIGLWILGTGVNLLVMFYAFFSGCYSATLKVGTNTEYIIIFIIIVVACLFTFKLARDYGIEKEKERPSIHALFIIIIEILLVTTLSIALRYVGYKCGETLAMILVAFLVITNIALEILDAKEEKKSQSKKD